MQLPPRTCSTHSRGQAYRTCFADTQPLPTNEPLYWMRGAAASHRRHSAAPPPSLPKRTPGPQYLPHWPASMDGSKSIGVQPSALITASTLERSCTMRGTSCTSIGLWQWLHSPPHSRPPLCCAGAERAAPAAEAGVGLLEGRATAGVANVTSLARWQREHPTCIQGTTGSARAGGGEGCI